MSPDFLLQERLGQAQALDKPADPRISRDRLNRLRTRNAAYIAQLHALGVWYQHVRRPRAAAQSAMAVSLVEEGIRIIEYCLAERLAQLRAIVDEHGDRDLPDVISLRPSSVAPCPIDLRGADSSDHPSWVTSLSRDDKARLREWLDSAVAHATASIGGPQRV